MSPYLYLYSIYHSLFFNLLFTTLLSIQPLNPPPFISLNSYQSKESIIKLTSHYLSRQDFCSS
jgi:uncharacterized membrane protein